MLFAVKQIKNNPIDSNCYIITNDKSCVIVDPGSEKAEEIIETVEDFAAIPEYIILTHEHFDHIWACDKLRKEFGCKLICSSVCADDIVNSKKNFSLFYNGKGFVLNKADIILDEDNLEMTLGGIDFEFIMTPGHTNASISFLCGNYLFTGDTLIKGIRTVTKLYTGSKSALKNSIEKINALKGNNYTVCPGHGEMFGLDDYDTNIALK